MAYIHIYMYISISRMYIMFLLAGGLPAPFLNHLCSFQPTWNIRVGWVSGVGMPCTGTTSGETPDKRRTKWPKTQGFEFAEAFSRDAFFICCKAQNDALGSVSLTLTSKGGAENPPAGMYIMSNIAYIAYSIA